MTSLKTYVLLFFTSLSVVHLIGCFSLSSGAAQGQKLYLRPRSENTFIICPHYLDRTTRSHLIEVHHTGDSLNVRSSTPEWKNSLHIEIDNHIESSLDMYGEAPSASSGGASSKSALELDLVP